LTIEIPPWLGILILVVVSSGAIWKGEVEERIAGAALFVTVFATYLLRDHSWPSLQYAAFAMDAVMLAVLVFLALRTAKYWPLAAAGFQLLAVLTHIGKMIDPQVNQWAYLTAIVIFTYLVIIALAVGTWNSWRARARSHGSDLPR
jgi:hypothetical protein